MNDHTSFPPVFEPSQYLGRIRKAYTTPGVPLYCVWDDGHSRGDTLTVNVTTKSFHVTRAIRRAVLDLGGKVLSIKPQCLLFCDFTTNRDERHAVFSIWFELKEDRS